GLSLQQPRTRLPDPFLRCRDPRCFLRPSSCRKLSQCLNLPSPPGSPNKTSETGSKHRDLPLPPEDRARAAPRPDGASLPDILLHSSSHEASHNFPFSEHLSFLHH